MKIKAYITIIILTILFFPILITQNLFVAFSWVLTIPLLILISIILSVLEIPLFQKNITKNKIVKIFTEVMNVIYWLLIVWFFLWFFALSQ